MGRYQSWRKNACFKSVITRLYSKAISKVKNQSIIRDLGKIIKSSSFFCYRQVLTHSWVTGCQSSESLITPRQLQKQSSIQELNEFIKTTMAINRCISLESPEKKRFKLRLMNWKSVEANHSTTSRENLKLKNRLMSFSRTIDLEYTVKFCSIDEGIWNIKMQAKSGYERRIEVDSVFLRCLFEKNN